MKRKKTIILTIIIAVALSGVYLNRAYAHIYSRFDQHKQPEAIVMTTDMKAENIKYAALGDSLTYGTGADNTSQSWPAIVAGKMSSNQTSVELINLAVPSAVSQDVIDHQLAEAVKAQPDLVTIMIGVNDLHNLVSLDNYRKNLTLILSELKNKTKAKIVLINLPYLGTDSLLLPPYNLYFDNKTDNFNKVLSETAKEFAITPIDIHSTKNIFSADESLYGSDDFHPSAKGYGVWANLIYDAIR